MRLGRAGAAGIVLGVLGALVAVIFSVGHRQSVTGRNEGVVLLVAGALFVLGDVLIRGRST